MSNAAGSVTSTIVTLQVRPLTRSDRFTPLWSLAPGSRPYLTTDNKHRGLAYNSLTTNLLVVSRTLGDTNVYVLDAKTGADRYRLRNTDDNGANFIFGGFTDFALNMIGVGDDGAVYAGNLSTTGGNFILYRWADDGSNTPPTEAFASGNPGLVRVGDTMDVRGAGASTQVMVGSRNGTTVAIFTTTDGLTFTPTVIDTPDAQPGNFGIGITFGEGNTFWGRANGDLPLRQVQFDLATGQGTTLQSFPSSQFPPGLAPLSYDPATRLLAAVAVETPDNLRIYDVSRSNEPPVLLHQELFATDNPNANNTGSIDFGPGAVYALDSNNGILALSFSSGTNQPPATNDFRILNITQPTNDTVRITWESESGRIYQVQVKNTLAESWANLADGTVTATGAVSSYTAPITGAAQRYYRVVRLP